jgi:teichuronic acid biosynthesis glycosyltransferase TuaG
MKSTPLISIIIPLYNAEDYIVETLTSIRNQSFKNYEVIIIDNVSTDNSVKLVENFSCHFSNFKLLTTQKNSGGPAYPRNLGVAASKGDYVAFLDSDDIWHSEKLIKQISLMLQKNLNFTSTSSLLINDKSESINNSVRNLGGRYKKYGIKSMLFRNTIITSSVIVKRDFLADFRFDESKNMVTVEDYLLWLNLFALEKCQFIQLLDQLVDYRVTSNSLGHTNGKLRFATKGLLATSQFLVESKQSDLLHLVLLSNILRLIKLYFTRRYN